MRSERCRVVVKTRPTFEHEEEVLDDIIYIPSDGKITVTAQGKDREPKEFTADRVYLPKHGDAVYEDEVSQLVESLYQGFTSTVFAYGASGSGKTHTVLGSRQAPGHTRAPGLIDRVIDDIFARYDDRTCELTVSIEELYKEQPTDLLAPVDSHISRHATAHFGTTSKMHQAAKHKRQASGQKVSNAKDLSELVHRTLRKRHTGQTLLNQKSSRSHVIVTLALEQRMPVCSDKHTTAAQEDADSSSSTVSRECSADLREATAAESEDGDCGSSDAGSFSTATTYLLGKLHLVDLAGSENIKRSGADGEHMKEAGIINRSLCHLKTVIEEVFKGRKVATYRNSLLTHRLQEALGGGKSKLLMIACISTARSNLPETKETLRFAEMARSICNRPTVNREPKDELIDRLRLEIEELHDQLSRASKGGTADELSQLQQQLNALEAAYAELQEEMEVKEAQWAEEAMNAKQNSQGLQQQLAVVSQELSASRSRESALQAQHQEQQTQIRQLQQLLMQEKSQVRCAHAAQAEAVEILRAAQSELLFIAGQCAELQQQLALQQAATAAAQQICSERQQQARYLQEQADMLITVKRTMQEEQQHRAAADAADARRQQALKQQTAGALAALSQSIGQLQEQLQQQQEARQSAEQLCATLENCMADEKAARSAAEHSCRSLEERLQRETDAGSVAKQQLLKVRGQLDDLREQLQTQQQARQFAESALTATASSMELVLQQLGVLQKQLSKQDEQHAVASCTCSSCSAAAKKLLQKFTAERSCTEALQQELAQQQQERQAECTAAAENAASMGAELEQDRWHIAQLQRQLLDTRAAHAAEMAALKQQHAEQLDSALQSSAQKAVADKLRCKVHLALQVHNLMADAQSLSEALASEVVTKLPETPTSTRLTAPVPVEAGKQMWERQQLQGPEDKQSQQQQGPIDQQLQEQQQQPPSENSRYQQQQMELDAEHQLHSEDGEELSFAGSDMALCEAGDDADDARDMQAEHVNAAGDEHARSSCSLASAFLVQEQQQHLQGPTPTSKRSSQSSTGRMKVPALALASLDAAEGITTIAAAAEAWPQTYLAESELDMVTAACLFASLGGGQLKVDNLVNWLKQRALGGQPHSMRLPGGTQKRKVHLVQDMLAWHRAESQVPSANRVALTCSNATSSSNSRRPSAGGSADGSAACSPSDGSITQPNSSCSSRDASGNGAPEIVDLCTPDTVKASTAAVAGGAAVTPHSADAAKAKTPRGGLLSPRRAAGSPASGSSMWGWLTPRSSKKKAKAAAAAAAAASAGSPFVQPFGILATAKAAGYECDIASSPAATGNRQSRDNSAAAVAEAVVSPRGHGNDSGFSAVQQFLLMEQQQDLALWAQHSAAVAAAAAAAGVGAVTDNTGLQGRTLSAHRSNWRRVQLHVTKSSRH